MLPILYKILQLTAYPMSQYVMYGVDRAKTSKYVEHKLYKIENVPTVILLHGNKEVGRITESVKKSVEADLAYMIDDDITKQQMH